jgi:hypothetical protein
MTPAASESRSAAWNSPSAAMIFARRSRSASAWRAIARGQQVVELVLAERRAQRRLGDAQHAVLVVADRHDGLDRVDHPVDHRRLDADRDESPGPRAPRRRPTRKTTTRWYSRTMRIEHTGRTSRTTPRTSATICRGGHASRLAAGGRLCIRAQPCAVWSAPVADGGRLRMARARTRASIGA